VWKSKYCFKWQGIACCLQVFFMLVIKILLQGLFHACHKYCSKLQGMIFIPSKARNSIKDKGMSLANYICTMKAYKNLEKLEFLF